MSKERVLLQEEIVATIHDLLPRGWVVDEAEQLADGWWTVTARPQVMKPRSIHDVVEVRTAGETRLVAMARLAHKLGELHLAKDYPGTARRRS